MAGDFLGFCSESCAAVDNVALSGCRPRLKVLSIGCRNASPVAGGATEAMLLRTHPLLFTLSSHKTLSDHMHYM
jgi:hypothetical protein